ncbi:ATP-binding protein [Slackia exigua]|uniref:ATP-binding protein n=1 Tax=Slackia exigua TaxID=84109 RepID=UPI003B9E681A
MFDRVEASSSGGLPIGLSEEEYLAGRVSVLRNPLLAEAFFRLGYIEKFGTGVLRIKESYRGTQETPVFEVMGNSIPEILPRHSSDRRRAYRRPDARGSASPSG